MPEPSADTGELELALALSRPVGVRCIQAQV